MLFNPAKNKIGGFTENDGTIDFYLRINSLINKDSIVLDLGAGRGEWFEDDICIIRKNVRLLKDKVKKVIAADIDEAVLENKSSDEQILIKNNRIDLKLKYVDIVISDYVLEHVDNPLEFYNLVNLYLKPGGWFCARTPHKYSYTSLAALFFKNNTHSKLLKYIQPNRKEEDIFETRYQMNTCRDIKKIFRNWNNKSFIYKSEPSYYFGNKLIFKIQSLFHNILPAFICGNLFIFLQKPLNSFEVD